MDEIDKKAIEILLKAPYMSEEDIKKTVKLLKRMARMKGYKNEKNIKTVLDYWAYKAYKISISQI